MLAEQVVAAKESSDTHGDARRAKEDSRDRPSCHTSHLITPMPNV